MRGEGPASARPRVRMWLALVLLVPALAGCLDEGDGRDALSVDDEAEAVPFASAPGPLEVRVVEFDLGIEMFDDERRSMVPMHVRGSLHLPAGEGPFKVLGFVHGKFGTCAYPLLPELPWYFGNATPGPYGNCPDAAPVVEPVHSFEGYDYISGDLAGHGYVIVSVDANEDNDDRASFGGTVRAKLLLSVLDHLREGNEGRGGLAVFVEGRLDLVDIGIMGHSYGGQAVATAYDLNLRRPPGDRHDIAAVFGLAPWGEGGVIDGAAYATLLPYCDGDVWTLDGARTFDRSIFLDDAYPKYQFLVMGTNHNHYNTVWARHRNDAAWMTDDYCGRSAPEGGFLGVEDTQRVGQELVSAFFRAHVGGEGAFLPLLEGRSGLPAEACPDVDVACQGVVHVAHHPGAAARLAPDIGSAADFTGFATVEWCEPAECPGQYNVGLNPQLHLAWQGPATWRTGLPEEQRDLRDYDHVGVRLGVNHDRPENDALDVQDLRFMLEDGRGRIASLSASDHADSLYVPPGTGSGPSARVPPPEYGSTMLGTSDQNARLVLNDLRVPLIAFEGVDLTDVHAVHLVFDATPRGSVQVADLLFVKDGPYLGVEEA